MPPSSSGESTHFAQSANGRFPFSGFRLVKKIIQLKMWYHKKKERGVRSYVEKYHRTDSTKIHCTFECIDYILRNEFE